MIISSFGQGRPHCSSVLFLQLVLCSLPTQIGAQILSGPSSATARLLKLLFSWVYRTQGANDFFSFYCECRIILYNKIEVLLSNARLCKCRIYITGSNCRLTINGQKYESPSYVNGPWAGNGVVIVWNARGGGEGSLVWPVVVKLSTLFYSGSSTTQC